MADIGILLIGAGTILILLAAVGLLRMPDIYLRLSATSKSSSLGVALVLIGVAMLLGEQSITLRVLIIIVFIFLTAPVASHVIGRAAYKSGVKLWSGSIADEMKDAAND
jgi:multicomponent Na+:H+ antiporter subunit G